MEEGREVDEIHAFHHAETWFPYGGRKVYLNEKVAGSKRGKFSIQFDEFYFFCIGVNAN